MTVAIIQCASNPSLDLLRDGAINAIKNRFKNKEEKIEFIVKNAEASTIQANSIAQRLYLNSAIDLFFTIGSGPTQAIFTHEKTRPIIFAGINNPEAIGITDAKNISGSIDSIDETKIIEMITALSPNTKKVGIIRSVGELSDQESIIFKKKLEEKNIQAFDFTVNTESDVIGRTIEACHKVDSIFVPTDSVVASAITYIIQETQKHATPLFLAFNEPVHQGAFAARGVDYKKNGEEIGEMISDILENKENIAQMGIKKATTNDIFVNKGTLTILNLNIPSFIKPYIRMIE